MAAAEAPFRISMLAMSSGFRSEMRLVGASWLLALSPGSAWVTAFCPEGIDTSLTTTPSITHSGLEPPLMVFTPRMLICTPPPGAPELVAICAPGTFPCSALSTVCAGVRSTRSCPDTVATALARLRRATLVAWPVTTTWSSRSASVARRKVTDDCDAGTACSCVP